MLLASAMWRNKVSIAADEAVNKNTLFILNSPTFPIYRERRSVSSKFPFDRKTSAILIEIEDGLQLQSWAVATANLSMVRLRLLTISRANADVKAY